MSYVQVTNINILVQTQWLQHTERRWNTISCLNVKYLNGVVRILTLGYRNQYVF